jgi:uncharacterized protein (DUF488 family)
MGGRTIWSIGHSNHESERLLELLRLHGIQVIADLRSMPRSGYNPQFNREPLRDLLAQSAIDYVFMGSELGGRPERDEYYDSADHVRYDLVADAPFFRRGLQNLRDAADNRRVAMLCSEENPTDCHRRLLVARVLEQEGDTVVHIRGDGRTETEDELPPLPGTEVVIDLFGAEERASWRSTRSVSRSGPRATSSSY